MQRKPKRSHTPAKTHWHMHLRAAIHTYSTKYHLCLRVSASGLAEQQEATSSSVSSLPQLQDSTALGACEKQSAWPPRPCPGHANWMMGHPTAAPLALLSYTPTAFLNLSNYPLNQMPDAEREPQTERALHKTSTNAFSASFNILSFYRGKQCFKWKGTYIIKMKGREKTKREESCT